jgi:hypothetical protein
MHVYLAVIEYFITLGVLFRLLRGVFVLSIENEPQANQLGITY